MELHRIPLFKTFDVVGYEFGEDTFCSGECVLIAMGELPPHEHTKADIETMDITVLRRWSAARRALRIQTFDTDDIETALDTLAARRGVTRERTSCFPRVITAGTEFPDYCPMCAGCLAPLDSFDPADYTSEPLDETDPGARPGELVPAHETHVTDARIPHPQIWPNYIDNPRPDAESEN